MKHKSFIKLHTMTMTRIVLLMDSWQCAAEESERQYLTETFLDAVDTDHVPPVNSQKLVSVAETEFLVPCPSHSHSISSTAGTVAL